VQKALALKTLDDDIAKIQSQINDKEEKLACDEPVM